MRSVLVICMLFAAAFVWADNKPIPQPSAANVVTGKVLEVKDIERYTYLRLKTAQGVKWAAVAKAPVRKGAQVTIQNVTLLKNFQHKAFKNTFREIAFGTLGADQTPRPRAGNEMAAAHVSAAGPIDAADARVPKAAGANAHTVAEIMTRSADLKDKPVLIRGRIVKYNPGIMGRNWLHLRDGSGSAGGKTNDLVVTTSEQARVGEVVTVKGMLRTDKDFSLGYSYKALVEEATLQR